MSFIILMMEIAILKSSETFHVQVSPDGTIEDVHKAIFDKIGLSPNEQVLYRGGREWLQPWMKIADCNIKSDSLLTLSQAMKEESITPDERNLICICSLLMKSWIMLFDPEEPVESFAERFCNEFHLYEPENCRFVFGGRQLEVGKTLQNYSIQKGDTVIFVPRLRG